MTSDINLENMIQMGISKLYQIGCPVTSDADLGKMSQIDISIIPQIGCPVPIWYTKLPIW